MSARISFGIRLLTALLAASVLHAGTVERVRVVATPEGGEVPDAEVDSAGNLHVAFVSGQDAYYIKSSDKGQTFTTPIRINSEAETVHPSNSYRGPDLAVGKNGRVHVIWYVNAYQRKLPQSEWGVFYSHIDPGAKAFAPARNLNHKPSDNYSLAANDKGEVAVVWMAGKLFLTSSKDNGESFSTTETISNADPCECCASRAVFSEAGALLIDYRDKANNQRDMQLLSRFPRERDFTRQKISATPWQVNACPMTGTFIGGGSKGLVTAWETKGQIFYTRLDQKGTPAKEISVSPQGKWPIALEGKDGTVLVSWKSGSTVWWQLFDSRDQRVGSAQSKPSGNANRHAGVVTNGDEFVLLN